MQDNSFVCNALILGREAIAPLRLFTVPIGNWIRGSVTLRQDDLIFSTNRLNALHQADASNLVVPYEDITSCSLGRLAAFLKTVDLATSRGTIRIRCLIAWNETLLAEVQKRAGV